MAATQGAGQQPSEAERRARAQEQRDAEEAEQRKARWPWIVAGIVVAAFVVIVLLIIFLPHSRVKTNDAYVAAHYAMIAPRVSGQVAAVTVDDNQPVRAGQLMVAIDDRDYCAALHQAEAQVAADRAQVDQASAQVARQPALIAQADAQVYAARARLGLSAVDAQRYANLASTGAGTVQQHQQADTTYRQDDASLAQALANREAARRQLDALAADRATARARVRSDEAALEQARLNLGYTRIYAPIDGTIDQRSVQVGNYVAPGAAMMIVVPLHAIYIEANYRELDLRHMRPGQHVRIHVDAYDIWLDGVVQSVAPASGAALSPIPPNNATGNFTKIVQRLPVKIVVAANQPLARLLRVGMSVETVVDTGLADVVAAQRQTDARITAAPPPAVPDPAATTGASAPR